jgi:hypothetical protein
MLVNLARGDIVLSGKRDIQVPLVVTKVQVHLTAIVENKDFAMPRKKSVLM